jgi:plasmid stabilization system protein ParE
MIHLFTNNRPDSALTFRYGEFFVRYKENGTQVFVPLNTADRKVAREMRDRIYEQLLAAGAKMPKRGKGRPPILPPDATSTDLPKNIFYRHPWQARVGKKVIGNYITQAAAERGLAKYMKTLKKETTTP